MEHEKIRALIKLLDDPDEEVNHRVTNEILSLGRKAIPSLEREWENCFDPELQSKIEDIVHQIQLTHLKASLHDWAGQDDQDLLEGAMLVSQYQYPDLDETELEETLDQLYSDIWLELNNNLTSFEKVNVMNQVLFSIHGFKGNVSNYLNPENTFLNKVLDSQQGNPVSLGVVYLILAQRLNLPVYGVNLPHHFILAYENQNELMWAKLLNQEDAKKILFYINPFNKGAVFTEREILTYLQKLNLDPKRPDGEWNPQYFEPCSNVTIVRLLFEQLEKSYQELGYPQKQEEVKEFVSTLKEYELPKDNSG